MSAYLGYNPDLIEPLLNAMDNAQLELVGLLSTDPAVTGPVAKLRHVADGLRLSWIPAVRAVIFDNSMASEPPANTFGFRWDVTTPLGTGADSHWRTMVDPLVAPGALATENFATWLEDQGEDFDEADILFIENQLTLIKASPRLIAVLYDKVGPDGVNALLDTLGEEHRHDRLKWVVYDAEEINGWKDLHAGQPSVADGAIRQLSEVVALAQAAGIEKRTAMQLCATLEPYAAALVVQHSGLDTDELADVAAAVIRREYQSDPASDSHHRGVAASDILMATVLRTPDGPSRFILGLQDDYALIVRSASDWTVVDRILREGTAPGSMSDAELARALPPLLAYIALEAQWPDSHGNVDDEDFELLAARLTSPHFLQLFDPSQDLFELDESQRSELWQAIAASETARQYFVVEHERVLAPFIRPLGHDAAADIHALKDLGTLIGLLDTLYVQGRVTVAERDEALWGATWMAVGLTANAVPGIGSKIGAKAALVAFKGVLENAGWGPDKPDQVRHDVLAETNLRATIVAAGLVAATFDTFVEEGKIPQDTALPPLPDADSEFVAVEYLAALETWVNDAGLDPVLRLWLTSCAYSVMSPSAAGAQAADRHNADD